MAARGTIYLTPKLYRKLDTIARLEAGCIVAVYPSYQHPGLYGYVGVMADSVYNCPLHELEIQRGYRFNVDAGTTHINTDMCVIYLANSIKKPTNEGYNELNYSKIPPCAFYEFVLWHEIAHLKNADTSLIFDMQAKGCLNNPETKEKFCMMRRGQEILADRYAWEKLFPGTPMPKGSVSDEVVSDCLAAVVECRQRYSDASWHKLPPPLSCNPSEYIYWRHETEGIPWSGPAKRFAAAHC